jgi:hypothetical protein
MCNRNTLHGIHQNNFRRATNTVATALALASISATALAADCINGLNAFDCTVPAGATSVKIEAWGAGGGGGYNNVYPYGKGGGGGGSYCGATFTVTPGTPLTVYVGSGGSTGSDGESSWVGGAGITGMEANGGYAGYDQQSPERISYGGEGGDTSACTAPGATKYTGGNGAAGYTTDMGGGGGGSATATSAGGSGSASTGGIGEGDGGVGVMPGDPGQFSAPGNLPGGGGGGGDSDFSSAGGADGQIIMTFSSAPPPTASIPTLGQYGLIGLSMLMALAGLARSRRPR